MERMSKSSRHCSLCNKVFSTPGNRKKHERIIHGVNDTGRISNSLGSSEQGKVFEVRLDLNYPNRKLQKR